MSASDREIVYTLRMQNQARAAIQQLVADLRSLQGAMPRGGVGGASGGGQGNSGAGGGRSGASASPNLPAAPNALFSQLQQLVGQNVVGALTAQLGGLSTSMLATLGAAAGITTATLELGKGMEFIIEKGDESQQSINKLMGTMHVNQDVATEFYDKLEQKAQAAGLSTHDLVDSYSQFTVALRGLGASSGEILQFTDSLTKLSVVSGTDPHYAALAFQELAKGMATGVIQGRELRIILKDMPTLADELAKGLGVSVGQLIEMAHAGKLLPLDLLRGLASQAGDLNKQLQGMPETVTRASGSMKTAVDQLASNIDHTLGLSHDLAAVWGAIANKIQQAAEAIPQTNSERLSPNQAKLAAAQKEAQGVDFSKGFYMKSNGDFGGTAALSEYIGRLKELVATEQAIKDRQDATATATDNQNSRLEANKQATDAVDEAMKALGADHEKTAGTVAKLTEIVNAGAFAMGIYGVSADTAGRLLGELETKIDPVKEKIAGLTIALREAHAENLGGKLGGDIQKAVDAAQSKRPDRALTDAEKTSIAASVKALDATTGAQDRQTASANALALAQARLRDKQSNDGGLQERRLKAQQDYDAALRKGVSPEEAGRERDQSLQTAAIDAQASKYGAQQKAIDTVNNALTQQADKAKEATEAVRAYEAAGAQESTRALIAAQAQTEVDKLQGKTKLELVGVQQKWIASLTAEAVAKGNLAADKQDADLKGEISDLRQEASMTSLSAGAKERYLKVQQAIRKLQESGNLADGAHLDRVKADIITASQLEGEKDLGEFITKTAAAYDEQAAALGLVGDALERVKLKRAVDAEAAKDGVTVSPAQNAQATDAMNDFFHKRNAQQADPYAGMQAGLQDLYDKSKDVFGQMKDLTESTVNDMSNALATFVTTGKINFQSLAESIISEMVKIAIQAAIVKPLLSAFGFGGLDLGGGAADWAGAGGVADGGWGAIATGHTGAILGMSDSNPTRILQPGAFSGAPRFHTGGILGSGEVPFIGKAGEAIMPTVRLSDGTMGVKSADGGNASNVYAPSTTVNVYNDGGSGGSDQDQQKQIQKYSTELNKAMELHLTQFTAKNMRPGGMFNPARAG